MGRPSVFGWHSPWSGDDNVPIPRRYWVWYQLYRSTRVVAHLYGLHVWSNDGPVVEYGHPFGVMRWSRCDWCGAERVRRVRP